MATVLLRECTTCDGEADTDCFNCRIGTPNREWVVSEIGATPDWDMLPEPTKNALRRYIEHHVPPGGFLISVLSNNLTQAVIRGDTQNLQALPHLVQWLNNHMPSTLWGSWKNYTTWADVSAH
jgi:hypothetical protein